jgi:hypothetical protein
VDGRSLEIMKEDGAGARNNVSVPEGADLALLVQMELGAQTDARAAFDEIQRSLDEADESFAGSTRGGSLGRFCRALERIGLLADTELGSHDDGRTADSQQRESDGSPRGASR